MHTAGHQWLKGGTLMPMNIQRSARWTGVSNSSSRASDAASAAVSLLDCTHP